MNANSHEYYRSVSSSVLARAKLASDPAALSDNEEDISCVICMNYVHYEVDEHGAPIRRDGAVDPSIGGAEPPEANGRMAIVRDLAGRVAARVRRAVGREGTGGVAARENEM